MKKQTAPKTNKGKKKKKKCDIVYISILAFVHV